MTAKKLAPLLVALVMMASGCLLRPGEKDGGNADTWSVPVWEPGDWWQYSGSDGITYTHRVEGRETKQGFEVFRVRVNLSHADGTGAVYYIHWYETNSLGWVAAQQGEFTYVGDCINEPWFPLQERIDWRCNATLSHQSGPIETYRENWTKVPLGWDNVTVPAGTFQVFKMDFVDNNEGRTTGTSWYSAKVRNRVQEEAEDDLVSRLVAWGTNAPNA